MGIVGGDRNYDGPGLASWAPWKCPRCAAENAGRIEDGCASCGSGSAKAQHVGVQAAKAEPPARVTSPVTTPIQPGPLPDLYAYADSWEAANRSASLAQAFVAGYRAAQAATMQAAPVTADVASLAPEGKSRRTIIAALEIFKEQVLPTAQEEIAAGEWCSAEEIEQIIAELQQQEKE